ncbi:hypothetical protein [Streptomyces sp. NBC_01240]|uniref:hypothetical protein n=1 Tax=Streptomyces sp. NBC_01240 TaxID=2903793 RepID=UPI002E148BD0|nr:hypothetical protein OG466_02300 [Streptomyces sp. NBC_01240]
MGPVLAAVTLSYYRRHRSPRSRGHSVLKQRPVREPCPPCRAAVEDFYRETYESRSNVMGARTMNMCVEDSGVTTEAYWAHVVPGEFLHDHGADADADAHYLVNYNIFQVFAHTDEAQLIGERIYVDSAGYRYEKLPPKDVVTPEQARRELAPLLSRATLA